MFFHDATRKTRTNCKNLTFFEDLSIINPRSHLKKKNYVSKILSGTIFFSTQKKKTKVNRSSIADLSFIRGSNDNLQMGGLSADKNIELPGD